MATGRTKLRKIENAAARQVTFSKRRKGLFKKAQELSILCDAEVGVIVFSCAGKLFEYSSSSIEEVIRRYHSPFKSMRPNSQDVLCFDSQVQPGDHTYLRNNIIETSNLLRQMRGEELQGLTVEELQRLEGTVQTGLSMVAGKKRSKILETIDDLHGKTTNLIQRNVQLKQMMQKTMNLL